MGIPVEENAMLGMLGGADGGTPTHAFQEHMHIGWRMAMREEAPFS